MNIEQKLKRLFGLQSEVFSSHKEERGQISDFRIKIVELETKISEDLTEIQLEIQRLEGEIKQETVLSQHSQRGEYLQAIYTKAPITFDSKRFQLAQPSLYEEFSKQGSPRVKITAIADETRKAV